MNRDIPSTIARYYDEKIRRHGPCAKGVDWKDEASQQLRFAQFERLLTRDAPFTLLDVGCGYGALLTYLRARGYPCSYCGIDLSAAMIEQAHNIHRNDAQARFVVGKATDGCFDYVVTSGIFNVRLDIPLEHWRTWCQNVAVSIAAQARRGFALNFLTSRADKEKQRADLYYAEPAEWLGWGLQISRHVALLHDYGLWEFTLIVRHEHPRG